MYPATLTRRSLLAATILLSWATTVAGGDSLHAPDLPPEVHEQCLGVLREGLASDEFWPAMHAAEALSLAGQGSEVLDALRPRLKAESDHQHRCGLAREIVRAGDRSAIHTLLDILADPTSHGRVHASESLYKIAEVGDGQLQGVREILIQLLEDDHLDVRIRAAQSLILLAHPPSDDAQVLSVDVYRATPENPRYSEGSVLALTDGTLAYATTEFIGGGADHATAQVVVCRSRDGGRTWSPSEVLQENVGTQNVMSVTLRRLQPGRHDGPIGLFYLVKNGPDDLHVHLRVSDDEMKSWSESRQVTERPGYHVMNNDRVTVTSSGRLLCPIAWTPHVTDNGHFVCLAYFSDDGGKTWQESAGEVDEQQRGAMEPEIVELRDGRLLMIIRTQMGYIATSYSEDGGNHWSDPGRLSLQAPEAPSTIRRIPATGDLLLVWNNHYEAGAGHGGKRWPLTAAISSDEGKTWKQIRNLDAQAGEQYAYTSVEFFRDRALLTYYVHDSETGRISSRFRSLPVSWFYQGTLADTE